MTTITLTAQQQQAVQGDCNDYNAANGTALTLDAFLQLLNANWADAAAKRRGSMPAYAFVDRFTSAEISAIRASTDPNVQGYLAQLKAYPTVNVTDQLTISGAQYLEAVGLIATGRAAQILTVN